LYTRADLLYGNFFFLSVGNDIFHWLIDSREMFGSIGTSELLIIVLVVLLVFGSKQLPQVVRSLGKGWRDIQRATDEVKDEIGSVLDDDELVG